MMSKIERYNAIDKAYSCRYCVRIKRRTGDRICVTCSRIISGMYYISEVCKTPTHVTNIKDCLTCEFYIEDEGEIRYTLKELMERDKK